MNNTYTFTFFKSLSTALLLAFVPHWQAQAQVGIDAAKGLQRHIQSNTSFRVFGQQGDSIYFTAPGGAIVAYNLVTRGWAQRTTEAISGFPANGQLANISKIGSFCTASDFNSKVFTSTNNWRTLSENANQTNAIAKAIDLGNGTILGLNRTAIYLSTNGGTSFTLTEGVASTARFPTDYSIDIALPNIYLELFGTSYFSKDAGRTWLRPAALEPPQGFNTVSVSLPDTGTTIELLYGGFSTYLLRKKKTTETNWRTLRNFFTGALEPSDIAFLNPRQGVIIGNNRDGRVLFTQDSGTTWDSTLIEPLAGRPVYISKINGKLYYHSSDVFGELTFGPNGLIFDQHLETISTSGSYREIAFGTRIGFLMGRTHCYISQNRGSTWRRIVSPAQVGEYILGGAVVGDSLLLCSGGFRTLYASSDLGQTWRTHGMPVNQQRLTLNWSVLSTGVVSVQGSSNYSNFGRSAPTYNIIANSITSNGYYIGVSGGSLFKGNVNLSTGGFAGPTSITGFVSGCAMQDTNLAYVLISNSSRPNFYRTRNYGRTWDPLATVPSHSSVQDESSIKILGGDSVIIMTRGDANFTTRYKIYASANGGDNFAELPIFAGYPLYVGKKLERWCENESQIWLSYNTPTLPVANKPLPPSRKLAQLDIWPNPTSIGGAISCTVAGMPARSATILDLAGRQIAAFSTLSEGKLSTSNLPSGVYIINAKGAANKSATGRLIIH